MPLSWQKISTNLDAVTSATNGAAVNVGALREISVFVLVSGNTGAVTVTIQASADDGTTWAALDAKTYTATNTNDVWSYVDHFPLMRVATSTQSASTVTAIIAGKGL